MRRTIQRLPYILTQRRCFTATTPVSAAVEASLSEDKRFQLYIDNLLHDYVKLQNQANSNSLTPDSRHRLLQITEPAKLCEVVKKTDEEIGELSLMMEAEKDDAMLDLMRQERVSLRGMKERLLGDILEQCVPSLDTDGLTDVILEIYAGVGGVEAGLFAYDLFNMYQGLCIHEGWQCAITDIKEMESVSSSKSISKVQLQISGNQTYKLLKFESGVHRVQRIPATERASRIHTSTAVVVVLPKPQNIHINIDKADIKVDVFKSRGGGGQSVNTTESAVRLTHIPTGTVVECQRDRSQIKNKKLALEELKCRLYERQLTDEQVKTSSMRRLQIGGANRNEKIRTYNYPQDRVTDHRVKVNMFGISSVLAGDTTLSSFLHSLVSMDKQERLLHWLDELHLQEIPS